MQNSTKKTLAVLGILAVAIVGGYFGAGFRGGASATAASSESAWIDGVKQRGELRVGVAPAPPMTTSDNGVLGGPNLIPLQHLADSLGVKLTTIPAAWSNIVAGLQANRYDVAANLDPTVERAQSIQFTAPVYEYEAVFVIRGDSPLSTAEDILKTGQPIATAQGSAASAALSAIGAQKLELGEFTAAFQAVKADRAVAEFVNLPLAEQQAISDPAFKIVVPKPTIHAESAGYGVPSTIDTRSLQMINIAITNSRISGALDQAYEKVGYLTVDNLGDLEKR